MSMSARRLVAGGWVPVGRTPTTGAGIQDHPVDITNLADEQLDGVLLLALDDPDAELPGLEECLARNEHILATSEQPSREQVQGFLRVVESHGLIKEGRPLTWREYLGSLLPT
jgi:hypothetical protein